VYQLHLGISEDLEKALRVFADARGITIAAAVRIILHDRLSEEEKP
jgi:plasmid stability protein